jgi:hypothetical protein
MFDLYERPANEDGQWDEDAEYEYIEGLADAYAESPEGIAIDNRCGGLRWAHMFLRYSLSHLGKFPPQLTVRNFREVLFEIIPRKVCVEPDEASVIVAELRAFWQFLDRQYGLAQAGDMLASLEGAEGPLAEALSDSSNFGMAKSFVMMAQRAGIDMNNQEEVARFVQFVNQGFANASSDARVHDPQPSPAPPHLTREERKKRRKQLERAKQRKRRR